MKKGLPPKGFYWVKGRQPYFYYFLAFVSAQKHQSP